MLMFSKLVFASVEKKINHLFGRQKPMDFLKLNEKKKVVPSGAYEISLLARVPFEDNFSVLKIMRTMRIWFISELLQFVSNLTTRNKLVQIYSDKVRKKINFVIDVGANEGQSIDFFLKLNPQCKIMAFEPNVKLYQKLVRKYSGKPNIKLFQVGISNEVGRKLFFRNVFERSSTFEPLDLSSKYLQRKAAILGVKPDEIIQEAYTVEVTALSDFINSQCNEPIDVLKIDTEGHEFSCLEGLFKNQLHCNIEYIQLETHNSDMFLDRKPFNEIEFLEKHGYKTEAEIEQNFSKTTEMLFRRKNN